MMNFAGHGIGELINEERRPKPLTHNAFIESGSFILGGCKKNIIIFQDKNRRGVTIFYTRLDKSCGINQ
jgi:hypothetical protein